MSQLKSSFESLRTKFGSLRTKFEDENHRNVNLPAIWRTFPHGLITQNTYVGGIIAAKDSRRIYIGESQ